MDVIVNAIELASELAHRELVTEKCFETGIGYDEADESLWKENEEGTLVYATEEIKDRFNEIYDEYFTFITNVGKTVKQ